MLATCNQSRQAAYRDLFNEHLDVELVEDVRASTNGSSRLVVNDLNGKYQSCCSGGSFLPRQAALLTNNNCGLSPINFFPIPLRTGFSDRARGRRAIRMDKRGYASLGFARRRGSGILAPRTLLAGYARFALVYAPSRKLQSRQWVQVVDENQYSADTGRNATVSLEILTGLARGTASWLSGTAIDISLDDKYMIRVAEAGSTPLDNVVVARLHRSGDSYEIESREDSSLWINGERVELKLLEQRDLIEFGESGPLSRYRVHRQGDRLKRSLSDMLEDCIDYTRVSRKPRITRLQNAFREFCRAFVVETTVIFRIIVVLALIALGIIVYQQYRFDIILQQQTVSSAHRLEDFARTLTRTNQEALRPADLSRLRQELSHSLSSAAERLEMLEQRSEASTRIIAEATRSIVFLQGAYGFRDIETNRMLRHRTDSEGNPLFTLRGQPLLTLEGEGEVAERPFTGTGFLIGKSGILLTNRHVALPWEDDTNDEALVAEGMEPVLIRFLGYLPGIESAFPMELLKASEEADLALLLCGDVIDGLPYLKLGKRLPEPGDEVILMGYPTGMRSMLAQTGDSFLADLQENEALDFWEVAQRLSQAQYIRPLASRGIVGQRSPTTVVYDADTTYGGSGGPVLNIAGEVIAVNAAIIPEYGGSNFGVPVEYARRLLLEAGIEIE